MAVGYTWVEYVTQNDKKEISSISLAGSVYTSVDNTEVYIKLSSDGAYAGTPSITTGVDGVFSIQLTAGTYDIKFVKTGFDTKEILGVVLGIGENLVLSVTMDVEIT